VPTPTTRQVLSYAAGLALAASLTACGGSPSTGSTTSTQSPAPTSSTPSVPAAAPSQSSATGSGEVPASPTGRTLAVTVRGKKVTPAPSTVDLKVGEKLTLTVTVDQDNVLHIHGFDVEEDLVAGQPLTVSLTGKQPGTYEVETHHPELRLLKIAVR
jgi:plastocyanin